MYISGERKKLLKTKLYCRNLIKRINTRAVQPERDSAPFINCTNGRISTNGPENKNTLRCIMFYMPETTQTNYMCQKKKEEQESPVLKRRYIDMITKKGSGISNEEYSPGIYPFYKVPAIEFCLEQFSSSPAIFSLNFVFHLNLFDGVSLHDAQVFVGFVLSECSNFVLIR